jgi:hypothetical protein
MDFTVTTYRELLKALTDQGFSFLTFEEFVKTTKDRFIILRHDVDALPYNSLQFARIQAELGIKGSYYFRIVPQSFDEKIISEIHSLGHEVGYHYEDVSLTVARQKTKGTRQKVQNVEYEKYIVELAIDSFKENLEKLRKIAPVNTICMHGSPLSKWDNKLLWKYYDYRDFGIIGEPYFDIDFNEVLYLTDTGRRWDGGSVSIRDKAEGTGHRAQSTVHPAPFPKFHSTHNIIKAAKDGLLPDKIMMTFHPQRWTDEPIPWLKELVRQNVKNVGKYLLVKAGNY